MRIKSSSVSGTPPNDNQLSVIRGVFGTTVSNHDGDSLIKSISAFPIQFNRP